MSADLAIGEDSHVDARVPVVAKSWEQIQRLGKLGVKVGDLPEKITFGGDRKLSGTYHRGQLTLRSEPVLHYGDWEFRLAPGSAVQTETEQHLIRARLRASEKISGTARSGLGKLAKLMPKELLGEGEGGWARPLFDDDGRLFLPLRSEGDLGSPKVRLEIDLPGADFLDKLPVQELDTLKDKAKEELEGLLEGLFD